MPATEHCDFLIIGAGIAGASAAYFLATDQVLRSDRSDRPAAATSPTKGNVRIVVLERESAPGYHSTGRSAALYYESYGAAQIRQLTLASRAFLEQPPPGFTQHPILSARGGLIVGVDGQQTQLVAYLDVVKSVSPLAQRLTAKQTLDYVPVLRTEGLIGAVLEPDVMDIDVDALHQGYLRGARAAGAQLQLESEVTAIARIGTDWEVQVKCRASDRSWQLQRWRAARIINAAGAWCDQIGQLVAPGLSIGLQPKRRTAFQFSAPAGVATRQWPCFLDVDEQWYVKPDAGMLIGSPANADPVAAHDVQAEELDVAYGIDRIEQATTLQIRRPTRVWAGLRSFVSDGGMVIGEDPQAPGFIWLAAQGGYGIQTSAAAGAAAAALAQGNGLPESLRVRGLSEVPLAPARLRSTYA